MKATQLIMDLTALVLEHGDMDVTGYLNETFSRQITGVRRHEWSSPYRPTIVVQISAPDETLVTVPRPQKPSSHP